MLPPTGVIRFALQAFRSYDRYEWATTESRHIALIGPNGVGKTNLLEALSLLTPGRGLRGAMVRDLQADHVSTQPWAIAASVQTPTGLLEVRSERLSLESERRTTKISGFPTKNQKELSHYLYALWLTPQMDGLFRESHNARRRFLDRLVLGFYPAHGSHVQAYEKALRERHRLFETPDAPSAWFEGLERTLAQESIIITSHRFTFLERLRSFLEEATGPFPKARLYLEGEWEKIFLEKGEKEAEVFLQNWLKTNRAFHQHLKQTPQGPHKSHLTAFFPPTLPAHKCSTGQQKMLLIATILAACQLHAHHNQNERCVLLLLDDVMAHLDPSHREALFECLLALPLQVWSTGTEMEWKRDHLEKIFLSHHMNVKRS